MVNVSGAEPVLRSAGGGRFERLVRIVPALLIAANAALTAFVVFYVHPPETAIFSDMGNYVQRAWEITRGHFDPIHFFQPIGYSLWLALARRAAGGGWWVLKFTHVALVSSSVYFGWLTARRLLPGRWDLLALLLLCVHLQWIALASFALSETLFTFFVTLLAWSAVRWADAPKVRFAALLGFAFAAGFYVKGSAALFPPLFAVWAIARTARERAPLRRLASHFAVMAAVALSLAALHGAFAYAKYGQFKIGADAGGLNFVEGKCPSKHNFDSAGYHWLSPLFAYLGETESKHWPVPFSNQSYYWREGWKCVQSDPAVLITSFRYVYYLFAGNPLWPVQDRRSHVEERVYEAYFAGLVIPFFIIGMIAAIRRWRAPLAVPALLYLALFATAWLFKSELRFRVPFDSITMLYASLGVALVWDVLRRFVAPRGPAHVGLTEEA